MTKLKNNHEDDAQENADDIAKKAKELEAQHIIINHTDWLDAYAAGYRP